MNSDDRGRELVQVVVERVVAEYPATAVEVIDGGNFHGTIATFIPPNLDGARMTLFSAFDWTFDLHVGRFIVVDSELIAGSATDHVDRVAHAILEVARDGLSRNWLDRLISFGRDRVAPWDR